MLMSEASAMSEQDEQGTAELLLSKPVKRSDYFAGKFLGGYLFFLLIVALTLFPFSCINLPTFLGTLSSLYLIPGLFLALGI